MCFFFEDFYSSKLPRIDLCSLHRLDEISEGFIHSPFYPESFVELRNCTKTIPTPEINHRLVKKDFVLFDEFLFFSLKIFAVDLDLKTSNWLEFNSNGNRLKTIQNPFTLIYDDIIEASIELKSSTKTKDSNPKKFLLYFIGEFFDVNRRKNNGNIRFFSDTNSSSTSNKNDDDDNDERRTVDQFTRRSSRRNKIEKYRRFDVFDRFTFSNFVRHALWFSSLQTVKNKQNSTTMKKNLRIRFSLDEMIDVFDI